MALPQNILDAQNQSAALTAKAGEFAVALPTITDELTKQTNKLYNDNADVLGLYNQGVTDLVAAPGRSYELFNDVRDPWAREKLKADWGAVNTLPALNAAGLKGQRMGNISDLVKAGGNTFQAQVTAASNAAQMARQNYEDVLNQWQIAEDARRQDEQLALQRQAAARAGGKSSSEKASDEVRKLIAEAGKLPENQRSAYIISNGFNPDDGNFSGLFTAQVSAKNQAETDYKKAQTNAANQQAAKDKAATDEAAAKKKKKEETTWYNPFTWFD